MAPTASLHSNLDSRAGGSGVLPSLFPPKVGTPSSPMDGTISLPAQTVVDSGCLSSSALLLDRLDSADSAEQPQDPDGSDGVNHNSSLRILNAVKLSLAVARTFAQHCRDPNIDLTSLVLDDFVARLEYSPTADDNGRQLPHADHLKVLASNGSIRWVRVVTMSIRKCPVACSPADMNVEALVGSLGKLLYAIFGAPAPPGEQDSAVGGEVDEMADTARSSKARRSKSKSLFEHLMQADYPVSVCRLLSDLNDRDNAPHPVSSIEDVILDLEQLCSIPRVFLDNPESQFFTSTLVFGQRYYGRSEQLSKLLDVTSVPNEQNSGLRVIFVSGKAGSGKSHLVSAVGDFLCSLGSIMLTAKFKRDSEHESRQILLTLFDQLVIRLIEMKDSGKASDRVYNQRAARAVSNAFDAESLSSLKEFVPSIEGLISIPEHEGRHSPCSHWQLIFLLSKMLSTVLGLGRKFFIVLDDLQWCDAAILGLMGEVLASIGLDRKARQNLVFVGMYRDDEISTDQMLFTTSFANMEENGSAIVTDVELTTLSLDDVVEILMNEMRLPRRLVRPLADVIHKRTHGHPLFVVQLLNSLVSDSTIAYSPKNHRFEWDQGKVSSLKTADSVAGLIVSNLSSLQPESLQCLRIMSCFGVQVQMGLLGLVEAFEMVPPGGFTCHITDLVDHFVIETDGSVVRFCHDLIQESVYEGIGEKKRRQLHLDIGVFLGSQTTLDARDSSLDAGVRRLTLNDSASDDDGSIVDSPSTASIATSQINSAGPAHFTDPVECARFAGWNLCCGKDAADRSNFRAALYFYQHGIAFLGKRVWLPDYYDLSLKLHEGAAYSSYALAETSLVSFFANEVISNVASFEDTTVVQYFLIGSLNVSGKYQEALASGLAVLRQLKFDLPANPSPLVVLQRIDDTEQEASRHDFSQIADYHTVHPKARNITKLIEVISVACYQTASPFMPLVACETVKFSLKHGVCEESAAAFIVFAYFQVFFKQDFGRGRFWGNVGRRMTEKASANGPTLRARFQLYSHVLFWFMSLQETSDHLQDVCDIALKVGEQEVVYMALCDKLRVLFFRGEQLSVLSSEFGMGFLEASAKFFEGSAMLSVLDLDMISALTGNTSVDPYSALGGVLFDKDAVLADARARNVPQKIEAVHLRDFFVSFWMGDYVEAEKAFILASSLPCAKMPKLRMVYRIFYGAILKFQFYRDGQGENWLDEGKEMMDQFEVWSKNSKQLFENKLILLEAEYYASECNVVAAKESYELSIKVARDNGYLHEAGLAYELMGKYLASIVELRDAEVCFLNAHKCYMQWGALAKADKLWKDHDLGKSTATIGSTSLKHERDEYNGIASPDVNPTF